MSWLDDAKAIWKTVAAVVPVLDSLITTVENAFPAGTPGSDKLAAVKALLDAGWSKLQGVETTLEAAWPVLSGLIGALVGIYNTIGLFKHKAA